MIILVTNSDLWRHSSDCRFQRFRRLFERAFAQLWELQQQQQPTPEGAAATAEDGDRSHVQKIDAGHFTYR